MRCYLLLNGSYSHRFPIYQTNRGIYERNNQHERQPRKRSRPASKHHLQVSIRKSRQIKFFRVSYGLARAETVTAMGLSFRVTSRSHSGYRPYFCRFTSKRLSTKRPITKTSLYGCCPAESYDYSTDCRKGYFSGRSLLRRFYE